MIEELNIINLQPFHRDISPFYENVLCPKCGQVNRREVPDHNDGFYETGFVRRPYRCFYCGGVWDKVDMEKEKAESKKRMRHYFG